MTLDEYAALHPYKEPEPEAAAPDPPEKATDPGPDPGEQIAEQKQALLSALEHGQPPQTLLFLALEIIGAATKDAEWTEAGREILAKVYPDQEQMTLFVDEAQEEAKRLEALQAEQREKTRKYLERAAKKASELQKAAEKMLQTLGTEGP